MSNKPKNQRYIYSVFSTELQDYPYYPFIAKTHKEALAKFISFISNRETVCEGAELHCIGTCKVNSENVIIDGSEQPYIVPYIVDFKNNILSKSFICKEYYSLKMQRYLYKLLDLLKRRFKDGK